MDTALALSQKETEPHITSKDLAHFCVMRQFREALAQAQREVGHHASFDDPRRLLNLGDYLSLFLFGLLNPVARSLRALSQASRLPKIQREICSRPASLGSLSEAQHLVDIKILERVFGVLVEKKKRRCAEQDGESAMKKTAEKLLDWMAHDGSVFTALNRMEWALYGGGPQNHSKAVKLHLSFYVEADVPAHASICEAKVCERTHLRAKLKRGGCYIADRLYGLDYTFFDHLREHECHFCIRIKDMSKINLIEEITVTREDRERGVLQQQLVTLGHKHWESAPIRLVYVRGISGEILLIVTDLAASELSAADVALLYKKRWEIEYYFRWVKCIMGCGHWLAESRNGCSIQIYLALIGSLLLQLQLGKRPSKRVWELFQWYQLGHLDKAQLQQELTRQLKSEQLARERRSGNPKVSLYRKVSPKDRP